jgi:2-keto-3-deoxy-L-rhamnonate aldolase RhmA
VTTLKQLAKQRQIKIGNFVVEFATPGIGHILKSAGCDYGFLDMEHSGFGFETVKSTVRYMQAAGLPMICRVPSSANHHLARACDMGVEGIMVPMVSNADHAKRIVDSIKYVPDGMRGVALQIAHDDYRAGGTKDKMVAANERTTIFALIETAEGIDNVDAIAALDGIDCLWIGHFDLSASLGIPGEFGHPRFTDAIDRVIAAGRKHNKALGRLAGTVASGLDLYKQGFDFICYSGDIWILHDGLKAAVDSLKAGAPAPSR